MDKNMVADEIIQAVIADKDSSFKKHEEFFSKTRDVFSARVQTFIVQTEKYFEGALIGEIGNNTFDHNFVFDANYPRGVYCDMVYQKNYTVLADWGRGIKRSLLPVVPSLQSDAEAVETAFTKRISGRSPEQRGNGLKFVHESVQQNNWHLYFQSGSGCCIIDKDDIKFFENAQILTGCLAIFQWQ